MPNVGRIISTIVTAIAIIFSVNIKIFAQSSGSTTGSILISVKDNQGNAIVGATVTAHLADTGVSRAGQSAPDGSCSLLQMTPGNYIVKAEAENFSPYERKIYLGIGVTVLLDMALNPGQIGDVV